MSGHSGLGTAGKKSSDVGMQTFSAENLQCNMKIIYYSRTFLSIVGGVIAGILGFTGLTGFIFYFLIMASTSVGIMAKAKFSVHSYFDSLNRVLFDGFLGGLMSYVLFWTDLLMTSYIYSEEYLAAAGADTFTLPSKFEE